MEAERTPDRWTDEFLDKMRCVGDPVADEVIMAVMQEHGLDTVNKIFIHLIKNDDIVPKELPDIVEKYLDDTDDLPDWADPGKLALGSETFSVHGPEIVLLLFGASLPVLYANARGAMILTLTEKMTQHLLRRIVETAQFVMDITDANAFKPEGSGIRTIQKVRLMHATIRYLVLHDPRWSTLWNKDVEVPVNQTDLAGTMMSFSITITEGLKKSGVRLKKAEQEAYLHLWKVVGHILGIQPELMPTSIADAKHFMRRWMKRYHVKSEPGEMLTTALVSLMKQNIAIPVLKGLPSSWIRFCIGGHTAKLLGVARYDWTLAVLHAQAVLWSFMERINLRSSFIRGFNRMISRQLIMGLLDFERGPDRSMFRLPEHLQDSLKIREKVQAKVEARAIANAETERA